MFKTEESRISIIILLTFALLLLTGIYPQYVLYTTVAFLIVIAALTVYQKIVKKRVMKYEQYDERTERCSLLATRNGFLVAIVMMALSAVLIKLGSTMDMFDMLQMIWGLSIGTYMLSYLYYKKMD
ncbi:hypothetical protein CUJ83_13800 [Methanocella sp. CWC-04]|uniref:Uncharacterized protein n=1 Tax=Methanooceanicella nereidis TaxID=2052831 RepID=A0AAP2RH17_9EURY|nr:hypothetical protein [Methanocella sp. CWC-04]MCD1296072.1 hypothetical protein [Methanocella sp. CWC-04]